MSTETHDKDLTLAQLFAQLVIGVILWRLLEG